jgi:hypothetical protein
MIWIQQTLSYKIKVEKFKNFFVKTYGIAKNAQIAKNDFLKIDFFFENRLKIKFSYSGDIMEPTEKIS